MKAKLWSKGSYVKFGQYEWLVLQQQGKYALLITRDAVEKYRFDWNSSSWENSKIRAYLNEEFYTAAFTDDERAKIVHTQVKTGESITEDYIFLLSTNKAQVYFNSNEERQCLLQGIASGYWLRSAGDSLKKASCISIDGSIDAIGYGVRSYLGVRPALWLKQDA